MLTRLGVRLALIAALAAYGSAAAAQSGAPRSVRIEVTDSGGRPVPSARVTVRESGASVRSDSNGIAVLSELPHSALNFSVNRIGFQPADFVLPADSAH